MNKRTMAIARAATVITATVGLVTGVTLAALNSSATLSNNNITSATADLTVWNGSSFAPTATGFSITNLVPGVGSGPLPFYLKNGGDVSLNLSLVATVPASSSGFTGWNNVLVTIHNDNTNVDTSTNLQALFSGVPLGGGTLASGAQGNSGVVNHAGNFHASFDIVPGSITGSQATIGNFDLIFTGTQ